MPLSDRARRSRKGLLVALIAALIVVIPAGVLAAKPATEKPKTIQLLNVSDWHGQIDPTLQTVGGVSNTPVGGASAIAARWAEDRLAFPSLILSAGDDFGATPPLSGFFDEIPSVVSQRMMGIRVEGLGNHNFDRGIDHLAQMTALAGAATSLDDPGQPFTYLAANLSDPSHELPGVKPWAMYTVGGVRVAVIGITNEEAPGLVSPGNFGDATITDGVAAANSKAAAARAAGANAVVVITHKGVRGFDVNGNAFGELIDFASAVDASNIDVILGDHTDVLYSGMINGILVHENRSKGVTYAKTLLTVNRGTGGRVVGKAVEFVTPVGPALTNAQLTSGTCPDPAAPGASPVAKYCDPAILTWLIPYRIELAHLLDVKVATLTGTFVRGGNIERRQEVPQGDLIADGMRAIQGTDFALMNGGSIRAPLPSSYTPLDTSFLRPPAAATPPWDMLLGDIYSTLPFANTILRRDVTGAQIWSALENGVSRFAADGTNADGRFAQVSGLKYSFDYSKTSGCTGAGATYACVPSRVFSVTFPNGDPIPNDSTVYSIALSSFVNQGGDSYLMFLDGTTGENEVLDALVFQQYLEEIGPLPTLDPTTYGGRITKCSGCAPA